jgi:hypothetical protein
MKKGEQNWKLVEQSFISFVKKILQRDFQVCNGNLPPLRENTFFLSLTYPDLT